MITCIGCRKEPKDISEYKYNGEDMPAEQFVREFDSTFNRFEKDKFYCTKCYMKAGSPRLPIQLVVIESESREVSTLVDHKVLLEYTGQPRPEELVEFASEVVEYPADKFGVNNLSVSSSGKGVVEVRWTSFKEEVNMK